MAQPEHTPQFVLGEAITPLVLSGADTVIYPRVAPVVYSVP